MASFESVFETAERAASELTSCAAKVQRLSRSLVKAAATGQPNKIKKTLEQIRTSIADLSNLASQAADACPLTKEDVETYLRNGYTDELIAAAKVNGVSLLRLDDRLAAFPVVLQVVPSQAAIKVGPKKLTTLRPSVVVKQIATEMSRTKIQPEKFIEVLYKCYRLVCPDDEQRGVSLIKVYDALTLLPQSREGYSKADFGRDIHFLKTSQVRRTASGATVSFPSATGAVGGRNTFVIVPKSGMPEYYSGVLFEGGN